MKNSTLAIYLSVSFLGSAYAAPIDITYESLRSLLESRSPQLEAHRLESEAAKTREGYLTRSFFPTLDFFAGQESFKRGLDAQKSQPAYGFEAKLNLFNGGRDRLESEVRTLTAMKQTSKYARVTADELLNVRSLYWEILYSQERLNLLESLIKINEQNSQSALKRIRSGVATESDKMEFEIKAVDLKQELEASKLKLKVQTDELKIALNAGTETKIRFPKPIEHEHDFELALKHSPSDHEFISKETDLQSEISSLSSSSHKRQWLPKVDVIAGYNQYNEREKEFADTNQRTESYIGLRVSLSVPDGLESNKESEARALEAISLKKTAEHQRRLAHGHMENEIEELRLLHSQIHDAEENITRAEKYYKLTQSEYTRGVKNSPDVLSASEKIFEVRNKHLEILKEFNVKQAHILSKINK